MLIRYVHILCLFWLPFFRGILKNSRLALRFLVPVRKKISLNSLSGRRFELCRIKIRKQRQQSCLGLLSKLRHELKAQLFILQLVFSLFFTAPWHVSKRSPRLLYKFFKVLNISCHFQLQDRALTNCFIGKSHPAEIRSLRLWRRQKIHPFTPSYVRKFTYIIDSM